MNDIDNSELDRVLYHVNEAWNSSKETHNSAVELEHSIAKLLVAGSAGALALIAAGATNDSPYNTCPIIISILLFCGALGSGMITLILRTKALSAKAMVEAEFSSELQKAIYRANQLHRMGQLTPENSPKMPQMRPVQEWLWNAWEIGMGIGSVLFFLGIIMSVVSVF